MSLTLIAWLLGLVALAFWSFRRPVGAAALYLYVYIIFPPVWWWGKAAGLEGLRWSFMAGWWLLLWVLAHPASRQRLEQMLRIDPWVFWYAINVLFVHAAFAVNHEASWRATVATLKICVLYYCLRAALVDKKSIHVMGIVLLVFSAYIGYEVTFNDRGAIIRGRLEGIGAPGASGANQLGSLMATILPYGAAASLATFPGWLWPAVGFLCALVINVILLVNSRGCFLGCLAAGVIFLAVTRGRLRRKAFWFAALGAVLVWQLLEDPQIVDRFLTTFADPEERDSSAAERLVLWGVGLEALMDRPFGAGGHGFKYGIGREYWTRVGLEYESRSVHNGYLNEAIQWGIQGLALKLIILVGGLWSAARATRRLSQTANTWDGILGAAICASLTAFLVTSVFGDFFKHEWGMWLAAVARCYAEAVRQPSSAAEVHWQGQASWATARQPARGTI